VQIGNSSSLIPKYVDNKSGMAGGAANHGAGCQRYRA
jgi:hypothetical protein